MRIGQLPVRRVSRELRRLEKDLHEREEELRHAAGRPQQAISLHFPLSNIRGIEVDGFAVALARVTLWMGHKLAVDESELNEATLPLGDLSGIRRADALRTEWPQADAVIGNPPFHGDRNLRRILGSPYVEWLKEEFGIGVKDYCVYWFRKAHDHLEQRKRAGLVGTNSISQNRARGVSLQYIVDNAGVITSAVSSQDWPGEAAVDVSIVNWIKEPPTPPQPIILDGAEVDAIDPSLRAGTDSEPVALPANRGVAFQGMLPGANYIADNRVAEHLRAQDQPRNRDVVRPYLSGSDIANDPLQRPSRFIVDFGTRTLEEAMEYPDPLQIVRFQARQSREESRSYGRNPRWWQFLWPRPVFREKVAGKGRFIAGTATGKRILFCWCDPEVVASPPPTSSRSTRNTTLSCSPPVFTPPWRYVMLALIPDLLHPDVSFRDVPLAIPDPPWAARSDCSCCASRRSRVGRKIRLECEIGLTRLYNEVDEGAYDAPRGTAPPSRQVGRKRLRLGS